MKKAKQDHTVHGKILEGYNFGEPAPIEQLARKILANVPAVGQKSHTCACSSIGATKCELI